MDNDAAMYIKNGDYNSACEIADEYYEQFKLDESEEILNEMYDKLIDEYGTGSEEAIRCLKKSHLSTGRSIILIMPCHFITRCLSGTIKTICFMNLTHLIRWPK